MSGGFYPFEKLFRVAPEPCEVLFCLRLLLVVLFPPDGTLLPPPLVRLFLEPALFYYLSFALSLLCSRRAYSIWRICLRIFLFISLYFSNSSSSVLTFRSRSPLLSYFWSAWTPNISPRSNGISWRFCFMNSTTLFHSCKVDYDFLLAVFYLNETPTADASCW